MSRIVPGRWKLSLGSWVLPLSSDRVEQLRRGTPFWRYLDEASVPATLFRIPVNFPPDRSAARAMSGMGTPDLLGTPGTFSFYTSQSGLDQKVAGGCIYPVSLINHRTRATLQGPDNPFRRIGQPPRHPKLQHRLRGRARPRTLGGQGRDPGAGVDSKRRGVE